MPEIITTTHPYYPGVFVVRFVNIIVGIIEAFFALRVVLELFGANPASSFIAWIYSVTGSMIGPFAGAFPNISIGGNSVIDVVAILAMLAYAVLGWIIIQILLFIFGSVARVQ